ncbi:hypothetical protein GCM10010279_48620 [Streptomyces mutabilis]|nr:hypothetical protein GCM10010279_48620 [Streptomyces mutabilis]
MDVVDEAPEEPAGRAPAADSDGFLTLVNSKSRPVSADTRLVSAARAHAAAMAAAGALSVENRDGVSVHQRVVSAGYTAGGGAGTYWTQLFGG